MKSQKRKIKRSLELVLAGLLFTHQVAFAQNASKNEDAFWYLQGQASTLSGNETASFQTALGGPVRINGSQVLNDGRSGSLALGRQKTYRKDNGDEIPLRLELELWSGRFSRERALLASRMETLNDQVQFSVTFLNAAIRLLESEKKYADTVLPVGQVWLKAGVGLGSGKYNDATANFGCNCMRAADSRATSFQLQLSYERQIGQNTQLFGQFGRVWLPAVSSEMSLGGSQTRYDRLGTNALTVGLRYAFL
jgi:hypothetical protein